MTLPASLAFYLDHAAEVDELVNMKNRPSDVSEEDWNKLRDVYAWVCGHVEAILDKARAAAKDALSSRAKTTPGKKQGIGQDRFAYTQVNPKSPIALEGTLFAGASLAVAAERRFLLLAPYLAVGATAQREGLVARLHDAGFSDCAAATDSDDAINLCTIPVGKDTDLDAAIAESTACFQLLAERWDKVFGPG